MPRVGLWMCVILLAVCGCGGNHDKAKVMVITQPPGAKVFLNQKLIGTAPVKCSVVDRHPDDLWEHHVIEARKEGYESGKKELRYRTGAAWLPKKVTFTLERIEGYVPKPPVAAAKDPLPAKPAIKVKKIKKTTAKPVKVKKVKTPTVKICKKPAVKIKKPVAKPTKVKKVKTPAAKICKKPAVKIKKPVAKPAKVKKVKTPTAKICKKPVVKTKKTVGKPAIVKVEMIKPPAPAVKKPKKPATKICKKPTAKIKKPAAKPAIVKVEICKKPAAKICKKPAAKIKKSASPQLAGKDTKPAAKMLCLSFAATAPWEQIASPENWPSIPVKFATSATASPKQSGKTLTATTPRTQTAPPSVATVAAKTKPAAKIEQNVQPPAADQRLACELRIIRVADKQVMGQTSALAVYGKRTELAEVMIRQLLEKIPEGKMVTAICLRNRRQTEQGKLLSDKMTTEVYHALKRAAHFQLVDRIDLRPIFHDETKLESARHITDPVVLRLLGNVDYVLLGGVAMAEQFSNSTDNKETPDIKPQNGF